MRSKLLLILCLLACLWYPIAFGADGIKPGEHFRVPFLVDGVAVVNRATMLSTPDGALLIVLYVRGDTIAEVVYRIERTTAPPPDPTPPDIGPEPPDTPDANPWTPTDQWSDKVQPILEFKLGRADATSMGNLYGQAVTRIAAGELKTTRDLREWVIANGKELGLQGKYPGLADSMNSVMADAMGLDVRPLNIERTTEFLHTLAWAIWEAGR